MKIEEEEHEDFFSSAKIFQFIFLWDFELIADFIYVFRFFIYFFDQKSQLSKEGWKWEKNEYKQAKLTHFVLFEILHPYSKVFSFLDP